MLGGPDVVVPVGTGEPPAGALRVRLEQDVDAAEAGFLRALGGLLGSGLPPGGGGAGDAPRGLTADAAAVHELRGPLTALLGQGQLIEHGLAGSADASVRAAARTIVEQARRLRALIDALDPR